MWKFYKVVFVVVLLVWSLNSSANLREQQRQDFLQAEISINSGAKKDFSVISAGLESYPLYAYLEYQWLRRHLDKKVNVKAFLHHEKSSYYARRLRTVWLDYLYKQRQWKDFSTYYKTSNSKRMQCRYQWSRYQQNYKTKALLATQKIWLTGVSLPKDCDSLLAKFTQSKFLTQALVWQRFKLAIQARQIKLADYLSKKLSAAQTKKEARQWLKLAKNPELMTNASFLREVSRSQRSDMLVYTVQQLNRVDPDKALQLWQAKKLLFKVSKAQSYRAERSIALQLAFNKSDKAYAHFSQLSQADATTRIWAVRAALIEGNWAHVQAALNNLSAQEKQEQRWRYWQARTFLRTNQQEKGIAILEKLAKERSYYGFLAADFSQEEYAFANKPIEFDEQKKVEILSSKAFEVIQEFRALQRDKEAQLHWWDAVRNLKGNDMLIAAKIAQHWKWHKLAILTVARAKHWDDVDLRFPIEYAEKIKKNAQLQALDTFILYGLIRRESMFDEAANSPAGALGLMQIMPGTGKQIAKEMQLPWKSGRRLLDASVNLKFGAYYYKQMLENFSGNFILATAAYNAGPSRVNKWLEIDKDYQADIWVETIPYKETRAYVAAVLTYALVYQHLIGEDKVKMKDFMGDILAQETALVTTGQI